MQIVGSVAMVTGGSGGLGAAVVRSLVDAGAHVVVADLVASGAASVSSDLAGNVTFVETDVTDEVSVARAIATATALGPLRIVNLAHGAAGGLARLVDVNGEPHDWDLFKRTVDGYLNGSFNVLRLVAATMTGNERLETGERGVVVMTASIAGYEPTVGQIAYATAKGGIIALTLAAARDLSTSGIRVNSIAPGTFTTPAYGQTDEELNETWGPRVPFPPRMGRPPEYASLVVEICRNEYINGEVIRIDGAMRFGPRYPKPS